jgi:tRNA threonylcarbamoyladenosine modification (KEOPS) complex Cgi121 subunit
MLHRFDDAGMVAAGVLGPLRLADIMWMASKANRIAPLQVVRADRVVSWDHVASAAWHAARAFAEGRNHADRLDVEFVRYLAGRRQIRTALDVVGVPDGGGAAVVCGFGDKGDDAVRYFVHGLGLVEDDDVVPAGDAHDEARLHAALAALGVTTAMLGATPRALWPDLALERVASVDLARK